jgi:hypothetical protein
LVKEDALRRRENDARPVSALLVSEVLRRDINLYDREPDFANTFTQTVAGAFLPYIVFKMQYSLQLTESFPSLKELDRSLFSTCFHPFQLGFFTKFEQELDLLNLNKLYPDVPADEEETEEAAEVGNIMQEENNHPAEANAGVRQEMGEPTGVDAGIPEEIDADPGPEAGIQPGRINVKRPLEDLSSEFEPYEVFDISKGGRRRIPNNDSSMILPKYKPRIKKKPAKAEQTIPKAKYSMAREEFYEEMVHARSPTLRNDVVVTRILDSETIEPLQYDPWGAHMSPQNASVAHNQTWADLFVPGSTKVGGLVLENATPVLSTPYSPTQRVSRVQMIERQREDVPAVTLARNDSSSDATMFSQGADLEVVPTFFSESPVQRTHRIELEASSLPSTAPIFPNMTPDEFVLKGDFKLFGIMSVQLYSLQSPNVPGVHHQVSIPGDLSLGNLIPSVAHSGMDPNSIARHHIDVPLPPKQN